MRRIGKQFIDWGFFNNKAAIHDDDSLGKPCHDSQIVSDPNDGHTQFIAQPFYQIHDLRLNGNVQSRRGFIGDQNLRTA